jgi:hypothetical protein
MGNRGWDSPQSKATRVIKLTTHIHLVPSFRMIDLYLHSPTRLHGMMLNLLTMGITLPLCLYEYLYDCRMEQLHLHFEITDDVLRLNYVKNACKWFSGASQNGMYKNGQLSRYSKEVQTRRQGQEIFFYSTAISPAPGPTQPPIQWVPGAPSPG